MTIQPTTAGKRMTFSVLRGTVYRGQGWTRGDQRGAHALIPVRDAVAWARTLTWRWQKWTHTFPTSRRRGDKDFSKDGRKLTLTEMKTTVGGAHLEEGGAIKIQVVEIHIYKLFSPITRPSVQVK